LSSYFIVLQENAEMVPWSRAQSLLSTPFPILCSLIILSFNVT
jgi:hypothetical protein